MPAPNTNKYPSYRESPIANSKKGFRNRIFGLAVGLASIGPGVGQARAVGAVEQIGTKSSSPAQEELRGVKQKQKKREGPFPFGPVVTTSGMASSHSVTGGVYKARERIHRRMADRHAPPVSAFPKAPLSFKRIRGISSPGLPKGNRGVQRFPRAERRLAIECKGRRELDCKTHSCFSRMPFFVHGSIFWCPRRRGTTPIHPELGGYYLDAFSSYPLRTWLPSVYRGHNNWYTREGRALPFWAGCGRGGIRTPDTVVRSSFFNRHAVRAPGSSHCLGAYGFMFYSTIVGIQESVHEILMNLKDIVLRSNLYGTCDALICVKGPGYVTEAAKESSYAPEDRLLRAILGIQVSTSKETCLKLPIGGRGLTNSLGIR
ncbi:hypothetical protein WN944_010675 [Citrus x changshan-huyou]|uniref:Uncharacterized protein n=1 Tax=Citrus x changshan-huyou TaxID=2935761 RepID=A0AAP0MS49_9ROSI